MSEASDEKHGVLAKYAAFGLVCVALVVRLVAAVASFGAPLTFDARDYQRIAHSIAAGNGYPHALGSAGPTAFRPPGFPYFLAAVEKVTGYGPDAGRVAQALIGVAVVILIGLIAHQLLGRSAALVALAIASVYPPFIIFGTSLLSEPLFIAFALASVLAALKSRAAVRRRWRWAVAAGVLAGMAWLTRSSGPAVIVAAAAIVASISRPFSLRQLRRPLLTVGCALLVIAPWTIRNAVVLHSFVPVSDEAGYTLAGTYNATSAGSTTFPAGWIPAQKDFVNAQRMHGGNEATQDNQLLKAAIRYAAEHPLYVAKVGVFNVLRDLSLDVPFGIDSHSVSALEYRGEEYVSGMVADLGVAAFLILLVLAGIAISLRTARGIPRAFWLLPGLLALTLFLEPGNRMRLPIDPFLIILVVSAIPAIAAATRRRRHSKGRSTGHPDNGRYEEVAAPL